jgi:4-diphosphocytidyl-2C-methyl-D-erythritol kinase
LTKDELMETAIKIGADVPFFIHGENAYGKVLESGLKQQNQLKRKYY